MGTRHLTIVTDKQGDIKIAQYGQWDGYLSGQGFVVLDFLKNADLDKFNQQLQKIKFTNFNSEFREEYHNFLRSIGVTGEWVNMQQGRLLDAKYPLLSRDLGAKILSAVNDSQDEALFLTNSIDFATDSLFCEWAYEINLQTNEFIVYRGFNEKPLKSEERFYSLQKANSEYYPVKKLAIFDINNLPTEEEFISIDKED